MDKRWLEMWERLVNTPTGPDIDLKEKIESTYFIAEVLKDYGFDVQHRSATHVAVRGTPPYITLIGHLDTVFKRGEEKKRPFRVEGDRAYGPGVLDMKGGIIVLLAALESLNVDNLCVILNVDEELGSTSSRPVIDEYAAKTSYCLSFEPGFPDGSIIGARKGAAFGKLVVHGKKGHGSRLYEGANAIVEAAHKVTALWAMNPTFKYLTFNPSIISGGVKTNVTPDYVEVTMDVRFYDDLELKKFFETLDSISSLSYIPGTRTEYELNVNRGPMKECEELTTLARSRGFNPILSPGGGDISFFEKGLDGLGVDGGNLHSEDEYAIVSSFDKKVELARFLISELSSWRKPQEL
ncbi:MAG: glutamate carboxypeptidase [Thermotogota bacterium]|nr:glutamate carboxypeptidase [Thermotogota bacterium]MDK2864936.1 glutamate carboxypeptidase [Thermotogota bacterium]HCZ07275.1 peptidase M20 [Thermotogota bacterium]